MGFFGTLFGGEAESDAARLKREQAGLYDQKANQALTTGYATGTENLGKAVGAYQPLSDLAVGYNKGGSLFQDAIGINGGEGNARAAGAFQNAPGTQMAVDFAMEQINRRRAGQGMGASGNTDIDALKYSQNLQNQQYNDWVRNLQQSGQTGIGLVGAAAGGQAAGYTGLSNLAQQYAGNQVGVAGNVMAGINSANDQEAAGKAAGAKNLLNAGMSLASLAAGGAGGGGLGSALGGMFGGGTPTGQTFGGYGPQGQAGYGSGMYGGIRYPAV